MYTPPIMIFTKNLQNIGTKLSDFQEIPSKDKKYFLLGKGCYGYAEKMKSKKDGKIYAVKKIDRYSENFQMKDFKRETGIMIDLNHKNLIRLYGYFEDIEKIEKLKEIYNDDDDCINIGTEDKTVCCLVMELAKNGSLEKFYNNYKLSKKSYKNGEIINEDELINKSEDEIKKIINDNFIPLNEKIIIKFLEQLLDGIIYLHDRSIIHRDIKPDNILLDESNNIKIADFGISALLRNQNPINKNKDIDLFSNYTRKGPVDFASPEIIHYEKYDFKADIFSLGLTILCLMCFRIPIKIIDLENEEIDRKIIKEYMFKHYNEYLRNLVLRMVDNDKEFRPSAREAMDELIMIEKYIENPGGNSSIKSELDKKKDFGNIKKAHTQKINRTLQGNQNNFQYNRNNQGYQNNVYGQNNFNNPNNQYYHRNSAENINFNQNNIYNANINNQMLTQNQIFFQNNQNMMNMNQNNTPIMMNMNQNNTPIMMNNNQITNQNMMSLSAKYLNFNIKPKITSIIRVLQCLYGCFQDIGPISSLQYMIKVCYQNKTNQYSLTLDILDILSRSINPDNNFINSVYNLRNKLNVQIKMFSSNEEVSPNLIFYYIIKIINNEYMNNEIIYSNTIFKNLKTIEKIPQSSLSQILGKIKNFEQNKSPCYNNFYYLYLDVIKCPRCNNIFAVNENTLKASYFLGLPGGFDENVSTLIEYSMIEESENTRQNYKCKCGIYKGHGKTEKAFLNTPNYLFIDFEGHMKIKKHLVEKLDLTKYKLTDIGPNQYYLYAFIIKYNEQYMAYIKEGSSWISFYNEINKSQNISPSFDCIPYYAIYKGMN